MSLDIIIEDEKLGEVKSKLFDNMFEFVKNYDFNKMFENKPNLLPKYMGNFPFVWSIDPVEDSGFSIDHNDSVKLADVKFISVTLENSEYENYGCFMTEKALHEHIYLIMKTDEKTGKLITDGKAYESHSEATEALEDQEKAGKPEYNLMMSGRCNSIEAMIASLELIIADLRAGKTTGFNGTHDWQIYTE